MLRCVTTNMIIWIGKNVNFYRATAMLSAVYAVVVCLCVCVCLSHSGIVSKRHVAWYIFNSVGVAMYSKQQSKITRQSFVVFKSFLFHYYTSLSFYLHSYLM